MTKQIMLFIALVLALSPISLCAKQVFLKKAGIPIRTEEPYNSEYDSMYDSAMDYDMCSEHASMMDGFDWREQVDAILSATEGIEATLNENKVMYQDLHQQVQSLFNWFDQRESQRIDVINLIQSRIDGLDADLTSCNDESGRYQTDLLVEKQDLQAGLSTLSFNTSAEIANLNTQKTALAATLTTLTMQYDDVTLDAQEAASQVLGVLTSISNKFDEMIAEKTACLNAIDALLARIDTHSQKAQADWQLVSTTHCPV